MFVVDVGYEGMLLDADSFTLQLLSSFHTYI
jgi:hypothetical protein